jgi:chromosome segregation ATPase
MYTNANHLHYLSKTIVYQSNIHLAPANKQFRTMADNSTPQPNPNPNPNPTIDQEPMETTDDQRQKEALAAFTATLHSVGTNLEAPLRDRASNIQSNAVALERQEAELAENTQRLARQNQQWVGLADETREGLKEIGDVQNWAEMIERDLLALEDMMDDVERGDGRYESDDNRDRRDGETGLDGDVEAESNGHVDTDADGKKPDQPAKGWLRWW